MFILLWKYYSENRIIRFKLFWWNVKKNIKWNCTWYLKEKEINYGTWFRLNNIACNKSSSKFW